MSRKKDSGTFSMRHIAGLALYLMCISISSSVMARQSVIDLAGQWQIRIGDQNSQLQPVKLPGALRDSGLGEPTGPESKWIGKINRDAWNQSRFAKYLKSEDFKSPFWLQSELRYVGEATYLKNVTIPPDWAGRRIELLLERPHWRSQIFVDGRLAGADDSLGTPHRFDLTDALSVGEHELAIWIDNDVDTVDVGHNSHSVSDHTQSAWHGIVGRIELRTLPLVAIDRIQVHPAILDGSVKLLIKATNMTGATTTVNFSASVLQDGKIVGQLSKRIQLSNSSSVTEATVKLDQAVQHWDEFSPNLCTLEAVLEQAGQTIARRSETFGMRNVSTSGRQMLINGHPVFLRGTLECCIFPLTGFPPTDVEAWRKIVKVCKAQGLNHIRFHSWCPPKAAFIAADELGFYFQVECSSWPNASVTLEDHSPVDAWLFKEGQKVIDEYGNHPSFILLAAGNEPGGATSGRNYLAKWVEHFNQLDDRFLVTGGSGWPVLEENQFHVIPNPRIHGWHSGLTDSLNGQSPQTMSDYRSITEKHNQPVISHESGQWCAFPNLNEAGKYTGALRSRSHEIVEEMLKEKGLLGKASQFMMASGKLQVITYKHEIETLLRTPGSAGFQMLDLRDFPGQGMAPVGMLDPFWDLKPYVNPGEIRRFCGPVTPLARMKKRTWSSNENFSADIELSNFGPNSLENVGWNWSLRAGTQVLASGNERVSKIERGALGVIGEVEFELSEIVTPQKLKLTVSVPESDAENDWEFWVFPSQPQVDDVGDAIVTSWLDQEAIAKLKAGGKVLWLADPQHVRSEVRLGFSPIFWNLVWTGSEPPHTLGIYCDPKHDVFDSFPTEGHTNWQWWDIIKYAAPMSLDRFPDRLEPLIQIVPDWYAPEKLGLLFEAKIGKGKLVVCSIDLRSRLEKRPAAKLLLSSVLKYMNGSSFEPKHELNPTEIQELFYQPRRIQKFNAVVSASSSQKGYLPGKIIDGNAESIWHATWKPPPPSNVDWLQLDLARETELAGIRCLPRSDLKRTRIVQYEVLLSRDGVDWQIAATGKWSEYAGWKVAHFAQPVMARFIKLRSKSEFKNEQASLAEFDIILAKSGLIENQ